jgi:N-acyl-D-amino-acid deacylase
LLALLPGALVLLCSIGLQDPAIAGHEKRSGIVPTSGKPVAELAAFDAAMRRFIRDRRIPAGTLAVMKNGRLLLARGYGFADRARRHVIAANALLRIASISKPITAAAIYKLMHDGKIKPGTRVFPLLAINLPRGRKPDPRLKDITIQDLLEHRGGWDRDKAFDPMFRSREIAAALRKPGPATSRDIIRYMAGQPLQFTPGSKSVYSNFGYCVLGRVIEKVTGRSYLSYVRRAILAPLLIRDVQVGRTLPARRSPREPYYADPGTGASVFPRWGKASVLAPDGTFYLEAMDAHGGLIASAEDLVRFMQAYWLDGRPRGPREVATYCSFGSLPGTFGMALQRADGVNIAVLFNQRTDASGLKYDNIEEMMNRASDEVKRWPKD